MQRRILPSASVPILLLVVLFILGSCVLPGTATINVRNRISGRSITALYIYPQGAPDTRNEISSALDYDDVHVELGVAPGPVTVHAVIDSGVDVAMDHLTVVEGTIYPVWIEVGDIVP
jgi:hypothetical protein